MDHAPRAPTDRPAEGDGSQLVVEFAVAPTLGRRSVELGRQATLSDLDDQFWEAALPPSTSVVWLMGLWQRSVAARELALGHAATWRAESSALAVIGDDDVWGSPYAVGGYHVDPRFGGSDALARCREALARRGVEVMGDFVPNHVAIDHPWLTSHPERFVLGSEADLVRDPNSWFRSGGYVVAHGRDPHFAAWTDTAQLNVFHPAAVEALADTMVELSRQLDVLRVDMAMLLLNDVFTRTWGSHIGPAPESEVWTTVISRLRAHHGMCNLVAEAYWGREPQLLDLGFTATYDKTTYDLLRERRPDDVRAHLQANRHNLARHVRFIENHDEPRAATAFGDPLARVALGAIATLPGTVLIFDGQLEGRRVQAPVQFAMWPDEPSDAAQIAQHTAELEGFLSVRQGSWELLRAVPDDEPSTTLLAWSWTTLQVRRAVLVNLGDTEYVGSIELTGDAAHSWVHVRVPPVNIAIIELDPSAAKEP